MKKEQEKRLSYFKILTDTREQTAYKFPNSEIQMLKQGDYSVEFEGVNYENCIVVERKSSVSEIFSATGSGRKRWENELERLKPIDIKFVLCEFDFMDYVNECPPGLLEPSCVYGSLAKWQVQYNIPFIYCGNRANARAYMYKVFYEYVKHIILGLK